MSKHYRFGNSKFDKEEWDRDHWEHWMETMRPNPEEQERSPGSIGGTPYEGGVFTPASYGGGAEFYSVTGAYGNPLPRQKSLNHEGKGPKGYRRRDDRIHDEICERLTHHPLIDASTLDVHVENGEVTLSGEVTDRRMKHAVEDAVDQVSGVREIYNQLRVFRDRVA